jgi:hypothetical protein
MGNVSAPRHRRNSNFDFAAKRRKEIVLHARHVGAHETEDFPRWLIAWHWYNPKAEDPIWSLMEAAKRMGGKITEEQASAITKRRRLFASAGRLTTSPAFWASPMPNGRRCTSPPSGA